MKIKLKDVDGFKELVLRKGFSQRQLGRDLGVTESYACQIVNGSRNPGPSLAKKLSEVLEVGFDDIFFIESGNKSTHAELSEVGG